MGKQFRRSQSEEESLADKLKTWRTLADGVDPGREEVAFLGGDRAELEGLIEEITGLVTRSDKHEADLREAVRRRREAEARAAEVHGRMVLALRARFGKRSPRLYEFGIQPLALPGERKREREGPPDAEPA
ncbi:MAG TPA: hypothetical protein VF121_11195 [Thermoanaerobaculia bacterium]|nr:hypothetical protein [Thermoanaerobaculia bacterium]